MSPIKKKPPCFQYHKTAGLLLLHESFRQLRQFFLNNPAVTYELFPIHPQTDIQCNTIRMRGPRNSCGRNEICPDAPKRPCCRAPYSLILQDITGKLRSRIQSKTCMGDAKHLRIIKAFQPVKILSGLQSSVKIYNLPVFYNCFDRLCRSKQL